jgi:hypothetical protein
MYSASSSGNLNKMAVSAGCSAHDQYRKRNFVPLTGDFATDKTWNLYHTAPSLLHSHEMASRSSHLRSLKPHESALWISLPLHHLVKLPTLELSTDYGAPLFQLSIIDNLRYHFLLASILGPTESNRAWPIRKMYIQSTRLNSHFWFMFCLRQLVTMNRHPYV